jgi:holin-like protein
MVEAFFTLLTFELLGELLRGALHLPVPGPVVGMLLLAVCLVLRGRGNQESADTMTFTPLDQTASVLLKYMGLLFVPAGVGIIDEGHLLRQGWLPIAAGLIGSTVMSLLVTGLVMHHLVQKSEERSKTGATLPPATTRTAP